MLNRNFINLFSQDICLQNKNISIFANQFERGQLAQLVQSTSFTPRGSGVRIPHCPQQSFSSTEAFFMLYISFLLSCLHSVSIARYNINPLGNERCISD